MDPLQNLMERYLVDRGIPTDLARDAARRCTSRAEAGVVSGAAAGLLATWKSANAVAMGAAAAAGAVLGAGRAYLFTDDCSTFRELSLPELLGLVDRVVSE